MRASCLFMTVFLMCADSSSSESTVAERMRAYERVGLPRDRQRRLKLRMHDRDLHDLVGGVNTVVVSHGKVDVEQANDFGVHLQRLEDTGTGERFLTETSTNV